MLHVQSDSDEKPEAGRGQAIEARVFAVLPDRAPPGYASAPPDQLAFVLSDAGARVAVTERELLPRLQRAIEHGASIETVIVIDGPGGALTLDELVGRAAPGFDFNAAWRAVAPDDILTIAYTSATSGPPKGVEHTHASALAAAGRPRKSSRSSPAAE